MSRDEMHAAGGSVMADALKKAGAVKSVAAEKASRGRTMLTQVDDYNLVHWLLTREPKWGETCKDVFAQAQEALKIENLNYDHVNGRMKAFADRLPKATQPKDETVLGRLDRLELATALVAKAVVEMNSNLNSDQADFLREFVRDNWINKQTPV